MQYAIDFGTSNTIIVCWNKITEKAEVIKISGVTGPDYLIPSLLYMKNAQLQEYHVGQQVINQGLDISNNPRFFSTFKRGIGSKIQGFLPELDGQLITLEKVGEAFLTELIKQLEPRPESLILTVPVDSFESYRNWLTQVGHSWNIKDIQLLDEPTAAALGYQQTAARLILVFDFGGGTLDISLVDLGEKFTEKRPGIFLKLSDRILGTKANQKIKTAKVIAKAGINLGGADIDNWLVEYFQKVAELPKSSLSLRLVEKIKIQLSKQEEASEFYFDNRNLESYDLNLSREKFEEILKEHQFTTQIKELIEKVLQQAQRNGLEKDNIDAVLLVGGSSQIPLVQSCLKEYFESEKIHADQALEAIAKGALKLGNSLQVEDLLYHSYGIRHWNRRKNSHDWHCLIKAGQMYPTEKPVELTLGASVENQPSIELIVGEISGETSNREVYLNENRLVTRLIDSQAVQVQPLNDQEGARTIAQLNPPGVPGRDRLKIEFRVDQERFLRITVEDLMTGETLSKDQKVAQLS